MAVPLDAPMPGDLDLGPGFTLRVTALAVADGGVVSAVNVSNFSVLVGAESTGAFPGGPLAFGDFKLVPGPGA